MTKRNNLITDELPLLPREIGETDRAYTACVAYCTQGASTLRSLGADPTNDLPGYHQLRKWSYQHNWQDRRADYQERVRVRQEVIRDLGLSRAM